jgi:hypothetical protein
MLMRMFSEPSGNRGIRLLTVRTLQEQHCAGQHRSALLSRRAGRAGATREGSGSHDCCVHSL